MPETHFFNENWGLHAASRGFELGVDVRSGMLVRHPGVPSMLERSLQGLFATPFDAEPKPGLAYLPSAGPALVDPRNDHGNFHPWLAFLDPGATCGYTRRRCWFPGVNAHLPDATPR